MTDSEGSSLIIVTLSGNIGKRATTLITGSWLSLAPRRVSLERHADWLGSTMDLVSGSAQLDVIHPGLLLCSA